jgi:hypothetical protein
MSQSEILNYDPSRYLGEKLVELREVTIYASDMTKVMSLYLPASELINKRDEDIGRSVLRAFLAFNVDVSWANLDTDEEDKAKSEIANSLAHFYTNRLITNLIITYGERLQRGDGNDPEIKIVNHKEIDNQSERAKETELAALDRIIDHLRSKIEPNMAAAFINYPGFITNVWQAYLRNIAGKTVLSIREKKGDDHAISAEEFMTVSNEHWKWVFRQTLETTAERLVSQVLHRMNPAGMPFIELQTIVRGGLNVSLMISPIELRGVIKGIESKVTSEKSITFQISGDARELRINLPEESGFSQNDIIKLLSSIGRGGRHNVKVADLPGHIKEALGKRYVELGSMLTNVKQDAKAAFAILSNGWRSHILKTYPVLENHPDLVEEINPHSAPNDADGSGERAPWEITWEIAARDTIPGYKQMVIANPKKRVSADALKKAAIIPKEKN